MIFGQIEIDALTTYAIRTSTVLACLTSLLEIASGGRSIWTNIASFCVDAVF